MLKVSNKSFSQILTLSCYDFRNILSALSPAPLHQQSVLLLFNVYKPTNVSYTYNAILASELNREAQEAEDSVIKGTLINYMIRKDWRRQK